MGYEGQLSFQVNFKRKFYPTPYIFDSFVHNNLFHVVKLTKLHHMLRDMLDKVQNQINGGRDFSKTEFMEVVLLSVSLGISSQKQLK